MGTISTLSDFNVHQVYAHFELLPEQRTEMACMKFIYRLMADQLKASPRKALANKAVAASTIEILKTPYHLNKDYREDFFKNCEEPQYDPLLIAALCAEHINHANDVEEGKDNTTIFHHDFAQDVFQDALLIIEEADMLRAGINSELAKENYKGEVIRPESVFVAHIQTICKLADVQNFFNNESNDSLSKILQDDIPAARGFILKDANTGLINNRISSVLDSLVETLEDRIIERLKATSFIYTSQGVYPFPTP